MPLIQVAISGTVGKQVKSSTEVAELHNVILTPSGANASIKIRDGNASGEVILFARATSANGTVVVSTCHKFTKGMHVKVLGTLAEAYLDIS